MRKESEHEKVLTLIVPSYNMENYLARCCESVIVEDKLMKLFEVIIVNDGSTDRTSVIANDFVRKYPRTFRVINKENGHYGSCINAALKIVKGCYVKLLDADDTYDTYAFRKYLLFLSSLVGESSPDLVLTDAIRVDERGQCVQRHICHLPENECLHFADLPERILGNIWATWITYKTNMLSSIDYHQTEGIPYTDVQWSSLPMANVQTVVYFPVVLYRYLVGREGQSINGEALIAGIYKASAIMAFDSLLMYRKLCAIDAPLNSAFVRSKIISMYGAAYSWAILKVHTNESDAFMKQVDLKLKNVSPEIYSSVCIALKTVRNKFAYLQYWRRDYNSNSPMIKFVRFLKGVVEYAKSRQEGV